MENMIKIIRPRCGGKTTSLVKLAKEHGYILVEPTKECAVAVQKTAEMTGYHGVRVISAHEFLIEKQWIRDKYLIDELDCCLKFMGVCGYSNTELDDDGNEVRMDGEPRTAGGGSMTKQGAIDYFVFRKENGERILSNQCMNAEDCAIKALKFYQGWVSVKSRTPINHDCVLVYSSETGVEMACYETPGKWVGPDGWVENVTHWMPLPEKPEDET